MVNQAFDYAKKVISGEIVASKKINQAVRRFKRDLKRSKTDEFNYYFDEEKAESAIQFIELLPSTDGKEMKMYDFQKWIIGELYGWREKGTGNRRYNRAFISMARKNGKTFLASGMGVNSLLVEKEPAKGRQILFVSNALKQAKLGYNMMASQLKQASKQSAFIRQRVKILNAQITDLESESFAVALASDTSTLDGFAGTTVILDEWHEAKDRKVYNVLRTGQTQEKNGLLCVISTAGLNLNVPMFEEYTMLKKVLARKEEADRYFIAIWELDTPEELHDEEMWIKANPIFESDEKRAIMLPTLRDDVELAVKQNNLNSILVKSFNMWRQASEDSYIAVDDWNAGKLEELPDIQGKDVYLGIDLSKTNDLTSVSWVIPLEDRTFYCDSFSFVGTKYGLQDKIRRDGINYIELEKNGECHITKLESGIVDYEDVYDWLIRFIGKYDLLVHSVAYDPYNANTLVTKLEKDRYPMMEIRQGALTLNTPTRTFREQLYDGKIKHKGTKLLTHAVNNAILKEDNNGIQINKARNPNRIDPIVALMNAYVVGMDHYYETEEKRADNDFYKSEAFSF